MEFLIEVGALELDAAREPGADDINRLPGPVSWLGSGAVNGSSRYLLAYNQGYDISNGDTVAALRRLTGINTPTPCLRGENPCWAILSTEAGNRSGRVEIDGMAFGSTILVFSEGVERVRDKSGQVG